MWEKIKRLYHLFGAPKSFYDLSGRLLPWLLGAATILLSVGIVWGLLFAPMDYQQGNSFRIFYVHVPASVLAQSCYMLMAVCGVIVLVWRMKMAEMVLASAAPIGMVMTIIALVSGAVWGKPTWGTYWVWDARLTSVLILLFLYLGVMALQNAIRDASGAARAMAVLSVVGAINIPIIKYSVEWWNTLHQSATFTLTEKPTMPPEMWVPVLICALGFYCYFGAVLIMRTRNEVLRREQRTRWVQKIVEQEAGNAV